MSTVPNADTPPPANNASTHLNLISPATPASEEYVRPTAGSNAAGNVGENAGYQAGNGPRDAPASNEPPHSATAYMIPTGHMGGGAPVTAGNTEAGPDIGHGATILVANSGDRESGAPDASVSWGTVGESVEQPSPYTGVRDDFPKAPGLP